MNPILQTLIHFAGTYSVMLMIWSESFKSNSLVSQSKLPAKWTIIPSIEIELNLEMEYNIYLTRFNLHIAMKKGICFCRFSEVESVGTPC